MAWFTTRPQVSGFYWLLTQGDKNAGLPPQMAKVSVFSPGADGSVFHFHGPETLLSQYDGDLWCGPINPPEVV